MGSALRLQQAACHAFGTKPCYGFPFVSQERSTDEMEGGCDDCSLESAEKPPPEAARRDEDDHQRGLEGEERDDSDAAEGKD
jgi:hypothetical protein